MTTEAEMSQDLQLAGSRVRRAKVYFQPKFQDLRIRRANGINPSLKAGRLKTQREQMFQSKSEGRERPTSTLKQAGEILSYSVFLILLRTSTD